MSQGELAIVLHTHMPYVEGSGPGRSARSGCGRRSRTGTCRCSTCSRAAGASPDGRAPLTLSLTPVLADQLEAAGRDRALPDVPARDPAGVAPAGRRRAAGGRTGRPGGRARTLGGRVRADRGAAGGPARRRSSAGAWRSTRAGPRRRRTRCCRCSPPTPGSRCRCRPGSPRTAGGSGAGAAASGCPSARTRRGSTRRSRSRGTGDVRRADRYVRRSATPVICGRCETDDGPVLWPIDRATIALVWGEGGLSVATRPTATTTATRPTATARGGSTADPMTMAPRWPRRGSTPRTSSPASASGSPAAACASARWTPSCSATGGTRASPGCDAVLDEAGRQGLALTTLDDALARHQPVPAPDSGPRRHELGGGGRPADLEAPPVGRSRLAGADARARRRRPPGPVPARALRELLALQSSDWAFLAYRAAGRRLSAQRADGHAAALRAALTAAGPAGLDPRVRGLAPDLAGWS